MRSSLYKVGGHVFSVIFVVRLSGLQAYAAIVPSISGKRWDTSIADGLHETENKMAQIVPSYYLECLPDAAAAELCCKTIKV